MAMVEQWNWYYNGARVGHSTRMEAERWLRNGDRQFTDKFLRSISPVFVCPVCRNENRYSIDCRHPEAF